jgi:hypothetical protein
MERTFASKYSYNEGINHKHPVMVSSMQFYTLKVESAALCYGKLMHSPQYLPPPPPPKMSLPSPKGVASLARLRPELAEWEIFFPFMQPSLHKIASWKRKERKKAKLSSMRQRLLFYFVAIILYYNIA